MRKPVVVLLAAVMAASSALGSGAMGASPEPDQGSAASSATITYVHDELGRLEAVIDPSQGVARYRYDAVGDIVAIERPALTDLSIIEVTPDRGVAGDEITIQGTGFGNEPGSNTVTIGGVKAQVTSDDGATIVVAVPDGADGGPTAVTTPTGTATSDEAFTIGSGAPVITSVTPNIVQAGDIITVVGTNLGDDPSSADLAIDRTHARVNAASGTAIVGMVPYETGSGPVSIATVLGESIGPDLFVVPAPWTPYQVATAQRLVSGEPTPVTVPAGRIGMYTMHLNAHQRVVTAIPEGTLWGTLTVHDWRGHPISGLGTSPRLAQSGTVTLVLDNGASAADSSVTLLVTTVDDVEVAGTIDGDPAMLTTTTPGQHAVVRFEGHPGQSVSLSGIDLPTGSIVQVRDPAGTLLANAYGDGSGELAGALALDMDGIHLVDVDLGASFGQLGIKIATAGVEASPAPAALRTAVTGLAARVLGSRSASSQDAGCPSSTGGIDPDDGRLPISWRPSDPESWAPGPTAYAGAWVTGRAPSPWESVRALFARPGRTALSGRVLRLDGLPLVGARVALNGAAGCTDASGRFLLEGVEPGASVMRVDGTTASSPGHRYGTFDIGVSVAEGQTTVLGPTIWMPLLDLAHKVSVPKGRAAWSITTPRIPGLEVRIPAGSRLVDAHGKPVRSVSITPVPSDRAPFPVPAMAPMFPVYFTLQPKGIHLTSGRASVVYPNVGGDIDAARLRFWSYEADEGWETYGGGSVSPDGSQVIPEAGLRDIVPSAYVVYPPLPGNAPVTGQDPAGHGGEPVDLATGLFVQHSTDLHLDDVVPIDLARTYRTRDTVPHSFGVGASLWTDMYLASADATISADLVLDDGAAIHFVALPALPNATERYEAQTTRTDWFGARIYLGYESQDRDNPAGTVWVVARRDGTRYLFSHAALIGIRYPSGDTVTITRQNGEGHVEQITGPGGRWIRLLHQDPVRQDQITGAVDDLGRTVTYRYDPYQHLTQMIDAAGGVTSYTYDESGNLATVVTPRGIPFLRNEYDDGGRVVRQTQADGSVHTFDYQLDGNRVTQTRYTDPRGAVRRLEFDADGYITAVAWAAETPEEQTYKYELEPGTNRVLAFTDALGRRTEFTYDGSGRLLTRTDLADTPDAVVSSWQYEPVTGGVIVQTNPLGASTTITRDTRGAVTGVTDATDRTWSADVDASGRPAAITDPMGGAYSLTYRLGQPVAVTDANGSSWRLLRDGAGRVIATMDANGNVTTSAWDPLDRLVSRTDALGGTSAWAYDPDGNLTATTDALANTTTYTYSDLQWLATRTDPLGGSERYDYDPMGLLRSFTDAKGEVARFAYDPAYRLSQVAFGGSGDPLSFDSTIDYTWDTGNRLLSVTDSVSGAIERSYDGLDDILTEVTPQGTIRYAYDAAGRRTGMVADGQDPTTYEWDDAGRLTGIVRGPDRVSMSYDVAGHLSGQSLPNDVTASFARDANGATSTITYTSGSGNLGNLVYRRAPDRRPISVGGSLASTALPEPVSSATYDDAGQVLSWNDRTFAYDARGDELSDGRRTLAWDSRGQLVGASGPASATYAYDAFGRRVSGTVDGVTTTTLYDGANPIRELGSDDSATDLLMGPGLDSLYATTAAGVTRSVVRDDLGSVLGLVGADGAAAATRTYEPFGRADPPQGAIEFGFLSRPWDATGLVDMRARPYDPVMGRFLSRDPVTSDGLGLSTRVRPGTRLEPAVIAGLDGRVPGESLTSPRMGTPKPTR